VEPGHPHPNPVEVALETAQANVLILAAHEVAATA
jgi:hypothetical protein